VCPFPYGIFVSALSQNVILTRYDAIAMETEVLHGGSRSVLHVRADHPIGPVDVFTTHLAAGVDGGPLPCGPVCPDECVQGGATSNRDCQAIQTVRFIQETHDLGTPALLSGDFNTPPGSSVYQRFIDAGWQDAYLEAGNPECDSDTGIGCTSGRVDDELFEMESPENSVDERIDFAFVIPPAGDPSCAGSVDSGGDADGDGVPTKIFADDPNPFVEACGPAPAAICWPSDHEGMLVDLNCVP
jgi:hypothetical protein